MVGPGAADDEDGWRTRPGWRSAQVTASLEAYQALRDHKLATLPGVQKAHLHHRHETHRRRPAPPHHPGACRGHRP